MIPNHNISEGLYQHLHLHPIADRLTCAHGVGNGVVPLLLPLLLQLRTAAAVETKIDERLL